MRFLSGGESLEQAITHNVEGEMLQVYFLNTSTSIQSDLEHPQAIGFKKIVLFGERKGKE